MGYSNLSYAERCECIESDVIRVVAFEFLAPKYEVDESNRAFIVTDATAPKILDAVGTYELLVSSRDLQKLLAPSC